MCSAYNIVRHGQPEITTFTDASSHWWGAVLGSTTSKGACSPSKALHHIDYLEMLALSFTLKAFEEHPEDKHVRIMIGNNIAVTTLAHMGTSDSPSCNSLASLVWDWCLD